MKRKDDHIREALAQPTQSNDFDRVRFLHRAIPAVAVPDVDTSVVCFERRFAYPVYINAMTGGTAQAKTINEKLAKVAKRFGLMMASGSCSVAIKNPRSAPTFTPIRTLNPEGFVVANIGISAPVSYAQKAVELLRANALQVHMNAPQEVAMDEGDRDFSFWRANLKAMMDAVDVPIIAKEVGFGMSRETMEDLQTLGVDYIDVSGRGGTNFIAVENARSDAPIIGFENHGLSTVESLLEAKALQGMHVFASGGVRHAYDVVKALALGAEMVGMSKFFLTLATTYESDEIERRVAAFLDDIRKIMAVLDCADITSLRRLDMLYDADVEAFIRQRKAHHSPSQ